MGAIELSGLGADVVRVDDGRVQQLDDSIAGSVLSAEDEGWDEATLIWNAMVAKQPALVVRPATAQDVASTVDFARSHELLLSVKGGGHNIAGTSIVDGGLTLDMSRLRDVSVDLDRQVVEVGAGCLLQDVDRATQEHGLATVLGFVSETGVAGLTVGGGFGYLTRRWGWTVDNLEEAEVVTADGEIRTANRDENPDLFWALRGGGGNYGVVTRFAFTLHEVGPTITGGLIGWPIERAGDVLAAYRELTASAPRELTAVAFIRLAPPAPFIPENVHGKPIAAMNICHSGSNPEADLGPIRELGEPVVDIVTERSYIEQQSMLDVGEPKGLHRYWKTEFLPDLSNDFLDTFQAKASRVPTVPSNTVIFHVGGALNERAEDDGAIGNRDAEYVSGFAGTWPAEAGVGDEVVAWVRESWEAIRPFSTGGNYVNFHVFDDDDERTQDAYRGNFERLQQVKATYDPDNLFRINRNISPASR